LAEHAVGRKSEEEEEGGGGGGGWGAKRSSRGEQQATGSTSHRQHGWLSQSHVFVCGHVATGECWCQCECVRVLDSRQ